MTHLAVAWILIHIWLAMIKCAGVDWGCTH